MAAVATTMATMAHGAATSTHLRPPPTGEPEGAMPHRPCTASADVSGILAMNTTAFAVDAGAFAMNAGAFAVSAGAFTMSGTAFAMGGLSILRVQCRLI